MKLLQVSNQFQLLMLKLWFLLVNFKEKKKYVNHHNEDESFVCYLKKKLWIAEELFEMGKRLKELLLVKKLIILVKIRTWNQWKILVLNTD